MTQLERLVVIFVLVLIAFVINLIFSGCAGLQREYRFYTNDIEGTGAEITIKRGYEK